MASLSTATKRLETLEQPLWLRKIIRVMLYYSADIVLPFEKLFTLDC